MKKKMEQYTKQDEKVAQAGDIEARGVKMGDNPIQTSLTVKDLVNYGLILPRFIKDHKLISNECYQILLLIYHSWVNDKRGMTVYRITKIWAITGRDSDNITSAVDMKITRMRQAGLIEVIGKGNMNCNIYAPSAKVCKAIEEVLSNFKGCVIN